MTYYIKQKNHSRQAEPQPLNPERGFMQSCMWMSYRYCVGSHTIATHAHAGDMVTFLHDHPAFLSPERRAFMGRDIKGEINRHMHFMRNVSVDGFQTHNDAITLVLDACIERGIKPSEFFNYRYDVDCCEGTCQVAPADEPKREVDSLMDIEDMIVWLKVANYLDPTERVTYGMDGDIKTEEGFAFYDVGNNDTFIARHVGCITYAEHPHQCRYISDQFIKHIENI